MTDRKESNLQVLIADDDSINRKVLKHFIKAHSTITEAEDGNQTLQQYHQALEQGKPFDLIFLDNVMPGKHGIEVLEEIRAFESKNPDKVSKPISVIMLTGSAAPEQVDTLQRLGITYYLMKPYEEEKLMRELQRLGFVPDPQDQWE